MADNTDDLAENTIVQRVINYISSTEKIRIKKMAKLSDSAVAVYDNFKEFDVYFDSRSYRVRFEEVWRNDDGRSALFPDSLVGTRLGVLVGIGMTPHVKNFTEALRYARLNLEPLTEEAKFYRTLQSVEQATF